MRHFYTPLPGSLIPSSSFLEHQLSRTESEPRIRQNAIVKAEGREIQIDQFTVVSGGK